MADMMVLGCLDVLFWGVRTHIYTQLNVLVFEWKFWSKLHLLLIKGVYIGPSLLHKM